MNVFDLVAKISLDTSEYTQNLNTAKSGISSFGSKMKSGFGKVAKIGGAALATATTAVTAFAKSSVDVGMAFDSSMSQVAATMGNVDDMSEKSFNKLKEYATNLGVAFDDTTTATELSSEALRAFAQEMGSKTAFSAIQAADALNYMALAGYDATTSMDMLPNVLNLASAGGMELARASDMITDAQSALGLTLNETTEMVNKMAQASSKSNTSVSQMGDAILTVGGTARNLKGGTTELATVLGILADNGIKGSEGGTALRNVILSLSAPTDKASEALEQLGVNIFDANGNMRSMNDIFGDLNGALNSMTQQGKTQALSEIFNKVDLKSVNALLGATNDEFKNLYYSMETYEGLVKAGFEGIGDPLGTFGISAEKLAQHLQEAGDKQAFVNTMVSEYGMRAEQAEFTWEKFSGVALDTTNRFDELSGYIDKAAGSAQDMANTQLDNLNGDITLFKSALEGAQIAIAGGLTPTIRAFIQEGTEGLSKVTDAFKEGGLDGAFDAFSEIITQGTEKLLKATPKMVEVGSKLLIAVGRGIIKAVPSVFSGIASNLPMAIQPIVDKVDEVSGIIMKAVDAKFPALGALMHHIADIARTAIENIKAFWAENGEGILTKAKEIWGEIKSAISTAIEVAAQVVSGFIGEIEHLWRRFGRRITDITSAYVEFLQAIFERLKQGVGLVLAGIKVFWDTYGNQIMDIATKVWRFIGNVISQALNIIKKAIKIATAVIKGDWTAALEGIKSITSSIWNLIKYVISNVLNAIKAVISTAWGVIKSIVSIALEAIKSKVESIWNTIKEKISSAINSAKDAVKSAIESIKGYFASIVPSTITSKFESIKKKISDAINGAKDAVSSAIETIKGVLNTTLSFPKIRVPHFSITGGEAPWGIGGAGSPPRIDIQWYAKAMKDAYLLSGASIFGTMGGKFLGGGEAGNEILIGEQKALSMISAASGGAEIVALLEEIFRYLRTGMPSVLRDALADGLSFEIDGREFGRAVKAYAE